MYVLRMRAVNPARNCYRQYTVRVSRDLLGDLVVVVDWGRIGTEPHMRAEAFTDDVKAARRIRELLARRRSAKRRLGTAYEILEESGTDWLEATTRISASGVLANPSMNSLPL